MKFLYIILGFCNYGSGDFYSLIDQNCRWGPMASCNQRRWDTTTNFITHMDTQEQRLKQQILQELLEMLNLLFRNHSKIETKTNVKGKWKWRKSKRKTKCWYMHNERVVGHQLVLCTWWWQYIWVGPIHLSKKLQNCHNNSIFIIQKQQKDVLSFHFFTTLTQFFELWVMKIENKNQAKQMEWIWASQKWASQKVSFALWKFFHKEGWKSL